MYFLSQNERLLTKPSIHNKKIELNNANKSENRDTAHFLPAAFGEVAPMQGRRGDGRKIFNRPLDGETPKPWYQEMQNQNIYHHG